MEGPKRVGPSTGQPLKREEDRQATIVHGIPQERQEAGETRRYALGREFAPVTFGGTYVAGAAKTVSVRLGHTPTGFHYQVTDIGTLEITENASILVYPMNRADWNSSTIYVACNQAGAVGVAVELEVY